MSKIEGLIRRIVRLRQVAPEEKSLVFSQYPDALKLVGKALNVNNVSWVELKGGSKVSPLMHCKAACSPALHAFAWCVCSIILRTASSYLLCEACSARLGRLAT